MQRDVTKDFVDREKELDQFRQMLGGGGDKRILLLLEPPEKGKSYFILRLHEECRGVQPVVPYVHLDFDPNRSGLKGCMGIVSAVRRHLGDESTPAICACESDLHRHRVLVQGGSGDSGGVDFGKKGEFRQATVAGVAGRDHIQVNYTEAALDAEQIAERRIQLGRALCQDLVSVVDAHHRAVVFVDTFEVLLQEYRDDCTWLERWLFEPLCRELDRLILVVGGRPSCGSFFSRPSLWGHLVTPVRFDPLDDHHIREHYERRGVSLRGTATDLLEIARTSPARMALIGDLLEQAREGAR